MDWSASHIGFVIAAYAISGAVLGGLVAAILFRNWRIRRQLSTLERRKTREY